MSRIHKAYNIFVDSTITIKDEVFDSVVKHGLAVVPGSAHIKENSQMASNTILREAKQQAHDILQQAKREVKTIIDSSNQELEEIKREAFAKGYGEGRKEGLEEVKQEYSHYFDEVESIIKEINEKRSDLISSMEDEIVSFIMDIADKVLQYELERSDEAIVGIIKNAIARVRDQDILSLKIHPDHCPLPDIEGLCGVEILHYEKMEKGDCKVETSCGGISTGITTQLEQIRRSFQHLLPEG